MRNIIITVLVLMTVLTGCRRADSDGIILTNDSLENANIQTINDADEAKSAEDTTEDQTSNDSELVSNKSSSNDLVIFVCGAVNNPGVYHLREGLRIIDAIDAAGGFSEDADKTFVNLAAPISDGIKLQIPTTEETASASSAFDGSLETGSLQVRDDGLVNINRATIEELKTLPGIGDGIASKIIDYRSENGSFTRIEDIMKVSGIKDKLFSKIKDHITV